MTIKPLQEIPGTGEGTLVRTDGQVQEEAHLTSVRNPPGKEARIGRQDYLPESLSQVVAGEAQRKVTVDTEAVSKGKEQKAAQGPRHSRTATADSDTGGPIVPPMVAEEAQAGMVAAPTTRITAVEAGVPDTAEEPRRIPSRTEGPYRATQTCPRPIYRES